MNKECVQRNCNNLSYQDSEHCILHTKKPNYVDSEINERFNEALITLMIDQGYETYIRSNKPPFDTSAKSEIEKDLLKHLNNSDGPSTGKTKTSVYLKIYFEDIKFPKSKKNSYTKIIASAASSHFINCNFKSDSLTLSGKTVFFKDCSFECEWTLQSSRALKNINNVIYQDCKFQENVYSSFEPTADESSESLFRDCTFESTLYLTNTQFNEPVFNNSEKDKKRIKSIEIENCKFEERLSMNNLLIDSLIIKNTEINSKFEAKECFMKDVRFTNTNFNKVFDTFKTKYGNFKAEKNIFSDFTGFELCEFSCRELISEPNPAVFEYVTFLSFTNFRGSKFHTGLDLKNTNHKEAPNFLEADVSKESTNRETFRIIKHSFDRIGNHIEANRFFVLEMQKYQEELSGTINQERLIFIINKYTSNFGQSYLHPILWIILSSLIYQAIVYGHNENYLYKIHPLISKLASTVASALNEFALSIIPFSKFLEHGLEFISLIFYLIFASLTWQTIVAIKRHTKR